MVVSDDDSIGRRAWAYHDVGYARNEQGRVVLDPHIEEHGDPNGPVQTWGQCLHMSELGAAMLYAQAQKLDQITAAMRARNQQLYAGLSQIPGAKPRRLLDPAGDSGSFVLMTWPNREICKQLVEMTREAGVRPGPKGIGNIPMTGWGLHIYYNNVSLVKKRGVNSAGRPWSDPLNEFHKDISYEKGALPQMDDLIERSCLITVPPALTKETCDRIIEIYHDCAAQLGLA